jgi:hypothetical protein
VFVVIGRQIFFREKGLVKTNLVRESLSKKLFLLDCPKQQSLLTNGNDTKIKLDIVCEDFKLIN